MNCVAPPPGNQAPLPGAFHHALAEQPGGRSHSRSYAIQHAQLPRPVCAFLHPTYKRPSHSRNRRTDDQDLRLQLRLTPRLGASDFACSKKSMVLCSAVLKDVTESRSLAFSACSVPCKAGTAPFLLSVLYSDDIAGPQPE